LISLALVAVFGGAVFFWGLLAGRADARANPDPDRRGNEAIPWLVAGLLAGLISGVVCWFISRFYETIYVDGLGSELTTFAAFTAMVIFIAAMAGVAVGRKLVDRKPSARRRRSESAAYDEDRADTDAFAAVRDHESRES
jgi:MFS family permease